MNFIQLHHVVNFGDCSYILFFLVYLLICLIRRADQLIQEENDDVIPYCIAVGDVKKLVSFFTSRGQLKEALLVAQVLLHIYIYIPVWEMYLALSL